MKAFESLLPDDSTPLLYHEVEGEKSQKILTLHFLQNSNQQGAVRSYSRATIQKRRCREIGNNGSTENASSNAKRRNQRRNESAEERRLRIERRRAARTELSLQSVPEPNSTVHYFHEQHAEVKHTKY